jgi:hypothetical protein
MKNEQFKPICRTYPNGSKHWYHNGKLHREDGPAIEYANGTKYWYLNGKSHREAGPAIEYADGTKRWFFQDVEYTEHDYWKELYKLGKITQEQLILELL